MLSGPRRLERGKSWWASRLLRLMVVLVCLGPPARTPAAGAVPISDPIVFCQIPAADPVERQPLAPGMLRADYGSGGRLMILEADGQTRLLTPDFHSACDPEVSFDGTKILFAGKKEADDPWNIWELELGSGAVRQITHEGLDCRHPIYLSTLYTITSTEPWYTLLFVGQDGVLDEEGSAPATSLYTVRLDGSELRRITYNLGSENDPFLMPDGRLIFAGWQDSPPASGLGGRVSIFGVNTDGTDFALFGGRQGAALQQMPTVSEDGLVLFIESDQPEWDGAGRLASVRRQRPHHSYQRLTEREEGLFHSPSPLPDRGVLVSRRPGDGSGDHGLYRFWPSGRELESVYDAPGSHEIHGRLVRPRQQPDGRSSTVRPESPTGKLYCLDVYEADGTVGPKVPRGTVERVRVIEGLPPSRGVAQSDRARFDELGVRPPVTSRRLLGEAPVEADGSFHIDVPADTPVELQTLDADGMALATCGWIWSRPREFRGCIGCHEDPERTPENRFVEAAGRPANELDLPPERRRTVTFRDQVMPIIDSRCASCHDQAGETPQLTTADGGGDPWRAYSALLAPRPGEGTSGSGRYVDPGRARNSYLVWLLYGRDTSRPWDRDDEATREVPQSHVGLLEDVERRTLIEWIDLGAQWAAPAQVIGNETQGALP